MGAGNECSDQLAETAFKLPERDRTDELKRNKTSFKETPCSLTSLPFFMLSVFGRPFFEVGFCFVTLLFFVVVFLTRLFDRLSNLD